MDKEVRDIRETLPKTLDDLGYKVGEIASFEILGDVIPKYIKAKLEGRISDFVVISHGEHDLQGLACNNLYTIYVKKDKRKDLKKK